jgi:hypothetical protein
VAVVEVVVAARVAVVEVVRVAAPMPRTFHRFRRLTALRTQQGRTTALRMQALLVAAVAAVAAVAVAVAVGPQRRKSRRARPSR